MEGKAIYTLWLREVKKYWRSKPRLIGSIAQPFMFLAILGVGIGAAFSMAGSMINYMEFLSPGIIGMSILFNSIFAGVSVIFDKQFGFMKEILVAPVSRTSIALGKILGSGTLSFLTGLMIMVVAILIGGISLSNLTVFSVAVVAAFMLMTAFVFVSVGLIIASRMADMEGFQLIMNFLVMPVFLLSGAFFPVQGVPEWMQIIVYLNPLFYSVDGMRGALMGSSSVPFLIDLGIMFGLSILLIAIASYMFSKMEK